VPILTKHEMTESIAKCGNDCFNCPTYKENIRTSEKRRKCSEDWAKFLGIKLSPEKLRDCDGCSMPDSERQVYYLNCKIRKCATINNIENCAYCIGFPCEELLKVHSIQKIKNRDEYINQTGREISETDYSRIIEPYTGINHLNKIRMTLLDNDLIDYKRFSTTNRFATFDSSSFANESIQKIYSLLTSLCIEHNISYARLQTLRSRREQLMKILWAVGYYGTYRKDFNYIELDSKIFLSQKIYGMYRTLQEYFNDLKKYGIHCKIVPLVEKGWLTRTGGLRKEGWLIRLSFEGEIKEADTLEFFIDYLHKLSVKYGNTAFKMFNMAKII
jgi:hypothetical protein